MNTDLPKVEEAHHRLDRAGLPFNFLVRPGQTPCSDLTMLLIANTERLLRLS